MRVDELTEYVGERESRRSQSEWMLVPLRVFMLLSVILYGLDMRTIYVADAGEIVSDMGSPNASMSPSFCWHPVVIKIPNEESTSVYSQSPESSRGDWNEN